MQSAPLVHTHHSQIRMAQRGIDAHGLQAVTLFGDRFVLDDGTVLHLVTRQAASRLARETGRSPGEVDNRFRGLYAVLARSGAIITCGRRWSGKRGRMRRS